MGRMKLRATKIDIVVVLLDIELMLENSAVFQSQVADQILALTGMGYRTALLAAVRNPQMFETKVGERLRAGGVEIVTIVDRGIAINLVTMSFRLRSLRRKAKIGVAYVRGIWGPLVLAFAHPLDKVPHVYDVRGALTDELQSVGRGGLKVRIYAWLERWGISSAAHVTAVTTLLAKRIRDAYCITSVSVIPCCVDLSTAGVSAAEAARRREELGYGPFDVVLVYSGGLSHYQQVPAMLQVWSRLRDLPNVRFLLLTNDDPHSMPAVVGNLGDFGDRLKHMTLSRSEVPRTLAAADVGFMLRDSRELNLAASPVKFAEYLAAGLAVVASPGTGDASALVEKEALGVLLDPADPITGEAVVRELIAKISDGRVAFGERARAAAHHYFSWQGQRASFAHLYGPAATSVLPS